MTNRLYYDQTYLTSFDAVVTDVRQNENKIFISLDQSAFYPTSGGQPFDTGTINDFRVKDVFVDNNGEVWHEIDGLPEIGDVIHGEIDWKRRFDHMQQHAGEHMIAGAVWRLFQGNTIGLHLGSDFSSIDVTMPDGSTHLTNEQITLIEDDVNEQIQKDVPIKCWFPSEDELVTLPLRKPPTVKEHIRIVAIGDCEMVACGGTHPNSAGQIALVKIIDARPSKGKLRLSFLCGQRAIRDYQKRYTISEQSATMLSSQVAQLPDSIERLKQTASDLEHELIRLRREEAARKIESFVEKAYVFNGYRIVKAVLPSLPTDTFRTMASELISRENVIALLACEKEGGYNIIFARNALTTVDMGKLLREAAAQFGGKGGGKPDFAQGSTSNIEMLDWTDNQLRILLS